MKQDFLPVAVAVAALILSPVQSFAVESNMDISPVVGSKAPAFTQTAHSIKKHKVVAIKLVDINGATRKQLKMLPGIGDAGADKIIAGRPYGSKANLVTQGVIDIMVYENIKKRIVARQPYKDGAKNAALLKEKK